jgi:hypothetical protein
MYLLTKHCGENDNFLRFAVCPIRDANLGGIEHQFDSTALHVIVRILSSSLEKRSRYLQTLLFLQNTFLSDYCVRMSKSEGIYHSSSRFDLELRRTIIHDFSSRDWCVLFCVLFNPLGDLLFTILVQGDMLSSLPTFIQPMREGRLDTKSWTFECSHQCIDRDWYIITRFCNIHHKCNLMASKFKSSTNRVPLQKSADVT